MFHFQIRGNPLDIAVSIETAVGRAQELALPTAQEPAQDRALGMTLGTLSPATVLKRTMAKSSLATIVASLVTSGGIASSPGNTPSEKKLSSKP